MTIKLELLAPARDCDIAKAAIVAGADAVYIGGPLLSARSEAKNDFAKIKELCEFAQIFNVKIYLALNTLLYDDELELAQQYLYQAKESGVDAIIFQDPALLQMDIPEGLELHASTQCDISTLDRFLFFKDLNVSQIVIPRELSLEDIKIFNAHKGGVRLEAFVAGAMCVAQSGICYISELLTKRSANRGQCAQICRLPMEMYNKNHEMIANGHLLSMKDNWALPDLLQLIKVGVSSFKIEGRLKDLEYVVNVTAKFRQSLDKIIADSNGLYERSSYGYHEYKFVPDEKKTFNRGFTDALLHGNNTLLVNTKTPKSLGNPIGKVLNVSYEHKNTIITINKLQVESLTNGDSFCYFKDQELQGFRSNKASFKNGHWSLEVPKYLTLDKNTILYRNVDTVFIKSIHQKNAFVRFIDLKTHMYFDNGNLILSYVDKYQREGRAKVAYAKELNVGFLTQEKILDKLKKLAIFNLKVSEVKLDSKIRSLDLSFADLTALKNEALKDYLFNITNIKSNYRYHLPINLPQFPEKTVDPRLILNKKAQDFYVKCGVDVSAKVSPLIQKSVMVCRNCLVKNHAMCKKDGGNTTGYYILIDKNRFDIVCDCKACKMHLILNEKQ